MSKTCWKVLFTEKKNVDNKEAIAFCQLGLLSCLPSSSQGFMICPASEADTFLTSELTAPQLLGSYLCWFHSSWQSGWSRFFFPNRFLKIPFVKKLAFFNDKRVFDYAIHMQDSSSRMGHFWLREECTSTVVHGLLRMCAGSLRPPSWYVRVWSWSKDAQCLSFDRSTVTVKYGFYRAINDSLYTTYVCPINFLTAG